MAALFTAQRAGGNAVFGPASGASSSTVTGVTVSPTTATGSATFTAPVTGTGGPSQAVTWTTTAGGITSGGVFTAPAATGSVQTITVTATSVQDGSYYGTATVTIASTLPTVGRPVSDVSAGAWTSSAGGALYAAIDEVVPDAADYISAAGLSTCTLALNNTAYPGGATQTVSYYAHSTTGNGITVALKQGATTIASWSHALTTTSALYTQTLTAGQIAAISAGALSVSVTST